MIVFIVNMNFFCFFFCMVLYVMIRNFVLNIDFFIGSCDCLKVLLFICLKVVGIVFILIVSLLILI